MGRYFIFVVFFKIKEGGKNVRRKTITNCRSFKETETR